MIPVKVDQLILSNMGFAVLLKSTADARSLPIIIGAAEAQAIALRLNNVDVPRPLTHDLLKNILDRLECRLTRVDVCDLRDGTFFAKLLLDMGKGSVVGMDSRPSDAIALALRCDAPIFVEEAVMNEAGRVFDEKEAKTGSMEPSQVRKKPESPTETLQRKLGEAVQEERYEDAARIRDEIERLKKPDSHN